MSRACCNPCPLPPSLATWLLLHVANSLPPIAHSGDRSDCVLLQVVKEMASMGTLLVWAALCRHTAQTHSSRRPTPLSQALGAPTCSVGQLQEALHLTVWTVLAVDALAQDGAGDLGLITLAVVLQAARALAVAACHSSTSNTTPVAQPLPCARPAPMWCPTPSPLMCFLSVSPTLCLATFG